MRTAQLILIAFSLFFTLTSFADSPPMPDSSEKPASTVNPAARVSSKMSANMVSDMSYAPQVLPQNNFYTQLTKALTVSSFIFSLFACLFFYKAGQFKTNDSKKSKRNFVIALLFFLIGSMTLISRSLIKDPQLPAQIYSPSFDPRAT